MLDQRLRSPPATSGPARCAARRGPSGCAAGVRGELVDVRRRGPRRHPARRGTRPRRRPRRPPGRRRAARRPARRRPGPPAPTGSRSRSARCARRRRATRRRRSAPRRAAPPGRTPRGAGCATAAPRGRHRRPPVRNAGRPPGGSSSSSSFSGASRPTYPTSRRPSGAIPAPQLGVAVHGVERLRGRRRAATAPCRRCRGRRAGEAGGRRREREVDLAVDLAGQRGPAAARRHRGRRTARRSRPGRSGRSRPSGSRARPAARAAW